MIVVSCIVILVVVTMTVHSFSMKAPVRGATSRHGVTRTARTTTQLAMGLFDGIFNNDDNNKKDKKDSYGNSLDLEYEKQQQILQQRRAPKAERDQYFLKVEKRRQNADAERQQNWGWQTKQYNYKKGEDPITEWKKRREDGTIGDLEDQYGDPKKIGGIPLPMASFGVGGEFGVGGKFDNGGRFDLRLPYADQGYVDEDADVMGKMSNFFGGNKKKKEAAAKAAAAAAAAAAEEAKKKKKWPW